MIWHPFTPQAGEAEPLRIARAQAEYLHDAEGREYIDAISSWWTVIHGHNHPGIVAAVKAQLDKLDHVLLAGFTHDPAEQLAAKLLQLTAGDFGRVFYSDNGSTAVEIMLKLAVQFWANQGKSAKNRFITFDASYHGDTVGAMSAGGDAVFNRIFSSLMFETQEFSYPTTVANAESILAEVDGYLGEQGDRVAGIILEPLIAAAGGMVFQDADVLRRLAELARKHRTLLLLDEVFTGMGRTGHMFAYQKAGIKPDLIALAKGLTGGMLPLAVTLVSEAVHAAFISEDPAKTFYHGHSMTGNPPGCAAALASLRLLEEDNRLQQAQELEKKMAKQWQALADSFREKIQHVRSLGAVSAANLVVKSGKPGYVFPAAKAIRAQALAEGVVLRPLGNVIYVTPPYNISDAALEKVFQVMEKILASYEI